LALLIEKSPKVLSRDEILNAVWGADHLGNQRTVDNSIVRLRDLCGNFIRSVRGVGYQWMEDDEH
jgi:DNA-binding response OmpR family regulator